MNTLNEDFFVIRIQAQFPDSDVVAMDMTGGGDHWEVRVASSAFKELSRIQRHQAIMGLFNDELKSGLLHALSIKTIEK